MAEPTPAYPVNERILQAVETALQGVTAANGYRLTVAEVHRPKVPGLNWTPKDLSAVLVMGVPRREPEQDRPGNPPLRGWRMPVLISGLVIQAETTTVPLDQRLNVLGAELTRAAMASPQWGGLALLTELGEPELFRDPSGAEGIMLTIEVVYSVRENDPFSTGRG
jgi:hypothetical protein